MRKFNIKVNGVQYDVEVEEIAEGFQPTAPIVTPVAVQAPVQKATPAPAPVKAPTNGTEVKAPMPGTVVGFKVNNGDTVKKGQAVVILEAMKMENEIAAPSDGVITMVAQKGNTVNTGDVLAIIA